MRHRVSDFGRAPAGRPSVDPAPAGPEPAGSELTERELTELALAADPDAPLDDDAIPLSKFLGQLPGMLPAWYMPTPMARGRSRWRTPVVVALVAAFVIIEAFGLCSTFGQIVPG